MRLKVDFKTVNEVITNSLKLTNRDQKRKIRKGYDDSDLDAFLAGVYAQGYEDAVHDFSKSSRAEKVGDEIFIDMNDIIFFICSKLDRADDAEKIVALCEEEFSDS